MNIKVFNATLTSLRASAMESLALIDLYLTDPTMVPDHSSVIKEVVRHSRELAEAEGAMLTLQQYFGPKPQAAPAPVPAPLPTTATISEEELKKRSPTLRKSQGVSRGRAKKPAEKK